MRTRLGRLRAPAAALTAAALVGLGAAPAHASDSNTDPVSGLVQTLTGQASSGGSGSPLPGAPALPGPGGLPGPGDLPGLPGAPAPAPGGQSGTSNAQGSSDVPPPSSDSDTPGHETPDPKAPDHGGATLTHAGVGGHDVADLGDSKASTRKDNSTSADTTLLALGGQEILGAHADSRKTGESHVGDPLAPLCKGSNGAVCLQVLYADAVAKDSGGTSYALSRSGVANACIGGDHTDASAPCDGPIALGVARSSAQSRRDQSTGRTTASSSSDLADVCLTQPGASGCALGVDAEHSAGQADSGGGKPSASRESYLLGVTANGKEQGRVDQPTEIAVQPGCASPSLLCAYLNQGETYLGKHVAGTAQDALDARVLPGTPLEVDANLARTETLVHQGAASTTGGTTGGGDRASGGGTGTGGAGGPGHPGSSLSKLAGVLPNTGGVWSGILAAGLGAVGLGSLLMAAARRRAFLG